MRRKCLTALVQGDKAGNLHLRLPGITCRAPQLLPFRQPDLHAQGSQHYGYLRPKEIAARFLPHSQILVHLGHLFGGLAAPGQRNINRTGTCKTKVAVGFLRDPEPCISNKAQTRQELTCSRPPRTSHSQAPREVGEEEDGGRRGGGGVGEEEGGTPPQSRVLPTSRYGEEAPCFPNDLPSVWCCFLLDTGHGLAA